MIAIEIDFARSILLIFFGLFIGIFIPYAPFFWNKYVLQSTLSHENSLLVEKPKLVPRHIAVIMDGNRRYGRKKLSDPIKGHWQGGQTLIDFVQWCMHDNIEVLTVYAFSTENWSRDPEEVSTLMSIFAKYAETFKNEALQKNVKVRVLSTNFDRLPVNVQASVLELERATTLCNGFRLNICLSYGGREEIVMACRSISTAVLTQKCNVEEINENMIASQLQTTDIPDPDIMIRTSGEMRISNFLLWQLAYSELFFIPKLWPELTQLDLRQVLHEYCQRQRRYGQ